MRPIPRLVHSASPDVNRTFEHGTRRRQALQRLGVRRRAHGGRCARGALVVVRRGAASARGARVGRPPAAERDPRRPRPRPAARERDASRPPPPSTRARWPPTATSTTTPSTARRSRSRIARWYSWERLRLLVGRREPALVVADVDPARRARPLDALARCTARTSSTRDWREIGVSAVHLVGAGGAYGGRPVTIITTDFGVRR